MKNHLSPLRPARTLIGFAIAAALLAPVLAAAQVVPVGAPATTPVTTRPPISASILAWSAPAATTLADTALIAKPNFGRAAVEVVGINLLVWSFDRFIREGGTNHVFRVGFNSWQENLEAGWTWDDNSFQTNQISHPFHGSLYYGAARSNGYSYWQSLPFTFAGSFMWEYFGETHNPSMNDWIATSVGGAAVGEILHRLAGTVRDNEATGSARNWQEVGGLFIDPVGGLNRIIDGDWGRQFANPEDRFPDNYKTRMDLGLRTRGEEKLWETDTTDVYIDFSFDYGDPFFGDLGKPYDNFDLDLQLNFGDKMTMGRVQGSGNLAGLFLKDAEKSAHILGAFHHYDYVNTNALEFGAQSVTAGLLSRWEYDSGFELRTDLQAGPLILAGISSDYANVSARSYDYGPGGAVVLDTELRKKGWSWAELRVSYFWVHSISGTVADHQVVASNLRIAVPVVHNIGAGAEFNVINAEHKYRDYPDVSQRNPQMRVFATFGMN
jgi:hypothetical protein